MDCATRKQQQLRAHHQQQQIQRHTHGRKRRRLQQQEQQQQSHYYHQQQQHVWLVVGILTIFLTQVSGKKKPSDKDKTTGKPEKIVTFWSGLQWIGRGINIWDIIYF